MKRIVMIFLTILLMRITCFSAIISEEITQDSIVSITSSQLKSANLIFVEHDKLLKENNLLNQQVYNYQIKTNLLSKTDSLRLEQLANYEALNSSYAKQVDDLNSTIKKKDRSILYLEIGGITIGVGLILFLLLK